jgi:very-short-patch-repair endonuclease
MPSFRRQHPFPPYILDFYCRSASLAVEIDGQSHGMGDRPEHDVRRDQYLTEQGVRVLRYPAELVMRDPNGVAQAIFDAARG